MPIPLLNTPLTVGTAGQVLQTDGGDPKGEINTSWVDKGGSGGLLTAVVDIGPTTNNGPGDQTKGIRDWSASPIAIVVAPGVGKINCIQSWDLQYKPGAGPTPYTDPGQFIGPFIGGAAVGQGLALSPAQVGFNGVDPIFVDWGNILRLSLAIYNFGGAVANTPIEFGDIAAAGELTTGDG